MIELSRHIENLMLMHDCVIVPGLGGFVTQYVPARRVADEQIFLPPFRSVGFNQQLTLNDGLLVQSYMQAYDTNYPETIKLINEAVHQLKEKLQEDGEYTLSGIGRLTLGIGGQYNFTPCEAGVLSPELYGLDALSLKEIKAEDKKEKEAEHANHAKKKKIQIKRTEKNYTFSISREFVNYAAAVAVAVFFYFLWATPVTPSDPADLQAASVVYEQLFAKPESPKPAPTNDVESSKAEMLIEPEVQKAEPVQATLNTDTQAPQESETQASAKNWNYTLVLVSAITENNAEQYSKQLKQKGFDEVSPYKHGNMVRVIYGYYATESEAQEALKDLHKHKDFEDAWILEKK